MSIFYIWALQGKKPYCDWYGLPSAEVTVTVTIEEEEELTEPLPDCNGKCAHCFNAPTCRKLADELEFNKEFPPVFDFKHICKEFDIDNPDYHNCLRCKRCNRCRELKDARENV